MRLHQFFAAPLLLLAGITFSVAQAQSGIVGGRPDAREMSRSDETSNLPQGAGEASTMTDGVPNALASNPQPGELGIQTRLRVRPARRQLADFAETQTMGASAARPGAVTIER